MHVPAIRFPVDRVTFLGIDPPEYITPGWKLEEGERKSGHGAWEGDLYGVGRVLGGKREGRGWREEMGVEDVLGGLEGEEREGVKGLLGWRGGGDGREVFGGWVPWEEGFPT